MEDFKFKRKRCELAIGADRCIVNTSDGSGAVPESQKKSRECYQMFVYEPLPQFVSYEDIQGPSSPASDGVDSRDGLYFRLPSQL